MANPITPYSGTTPRRGQSGVVFKDAMNALLAWIINFIVELNAAIAAMNLNATNSSSATSLTIGTGSKSLTVGTGLSYVAGMTVKIANSSSAWMQGEVTSYNSGSGALVVNVTSTVGAGTLSSWITSQAMGLGTTNIIPAQGIQFPATQVSSTDPNTLDDYEEGTFTPVLTFTTPGNVSVTYSSQYGFYQKVGNRVTVDINIVTSAFTHTTASGSLVITGMPFTSSGDTGSFIYGQLSWQGITKANYTDMALRLATSSTQVEVIASGSGQSNDAIAATDMPTGGAVILRGKLNYRV